MQVEHVLTGMEPALNLHLGHSKLLNRNQVNRTKFLLTACKVTCYASAVTGLCDD
jgi:tryptophanyl-tRNA synthetase